MSWRGTRLKHLCQDAGQYGLNVSADQYSDTGHRLIRTSDITESGELANEGVCVDVLIEPRHKLEPGDLLLSRSGTLGRALLVPEMVEDATYAGYLVRFRPRMDTHSRFLKYVALSDSFQDQIKSEAVTSTIQNFNAERYANIRVVAPPLEEQRRIADFLDAETSEIDRIVGLRRTQLGVLTERAQALVDSVLVRPDDDLVALSRLCRIQTGVTVDSGRTVEGTISRPYLRVANVKADGLELDDVKEIRVPPEAARRSELRVGDVLMTEGGDLDKLGRGTVWNGEIEKCIHQNHVFAVRPHRKLAGEFLALVTRTSLARAYFEMTGSKTTNLASTSTSKILAFRIPLPSRQLQQMRVQAANQKLSVNERLTRTLNRQLDLLAERRQALITAAVTGQLDVTTARSGARV